MDSIELVRITEGNCRFYNFQRQHLLRTGDPILYLGTLATVRRIGHTTPPIRQDLDISHHCSPWISKKKLDYSHILGNTFQATVEYDLHRRSTKVTNRTVIQLTTLPDRYTCDDFFWKSALAETVWDRWGGGVQKQNRTDLHILVAVHLQLDLQPVKLKISCVLGIVIRTTAHSFS